MDNFPEQTIFRNENLKWLRYIYRLYHYYSLKKNFWTVIWILEGIYEVDTSILSINNSIQLKVLMLADFISRRALIKIYSNNNNIVLCSYLTVSEQLSQYIILPLAPTDFARFINFLASQTINN